jgi:hypothetical protein
MKAIVFADSDLHYAWISAQILSDEGRVVSVELPRVIKNRLSASRVMAHIVDCDKWASTARIRTEMLEIARLLHKIGYEVLDANLDGYPDLQPVREGGEEK